jgi:hypothetical protein
MPLTLEEQGELNADEAWRRRVEAAVANYASYIVDLKVNTPPELVALVAALGDWATQAQTDSAVRAQWVERVRWAGVRKAVTTEGVTLESAQSAGFDGALSAEIEDKIRRAHGVA